MWDIFISFVSGSAFLGGMSAMFILCLCLRKKGEPTETEQRILASWREANELGRQANELRRERLKLDQEHIEILNEIHETIQSRTL